jgi:CRP-like cAMP-binding protein
MTPPDGPSLSTPRTDAAERFFLESGRPPVGFVDSWLARLLEVELSRALAQLAQMGGQAPAPLDKGALAQIKAARRPQREVLSQINTGTPASAGAAAAPQVSQLAAALAGESLGAVRTYEDGAVLYRRGEQSEHLFILLAGQLRVSERLDQGLDCILRSGQVLAEHSLFTESLHTETVHAAGEVRVVLINSASLRQRLAADTTLLPAVLMGLSLQHHMARELAWQSAAAQLPPSFALMGERTYTAPELRRLLLDAKSPSPAEPLSAEQIMCLQMQAGEQLPLRVLRAGEVLGQPGQEQTGLAVMVVSGKVRASWGTHALELGQGSVIGLAEALTGRPFAWTFTVEQDLNARVVPVERALQQIERAEPMLRALASHACAAIFLRQQEALAQS